MSRAKQRRRGRMIPQAREPIRDGRMIDDERTFHARAYPMKLKAPPGCG